MRCDDKEEVGARELSSMSRMMERRATWWRSGSETEGPETRVVVFCLLLESRGSKGDSEQKRPEKPLPEGKYLH